MAVDLRLYQSKTATTEVLGCLLLNPLLLAEHKLELNDFVEPFHQLLFRYSKPEAD